MKLFKLTKRFVPDYRGSEDGSESFYISDDVEKVKVFIKGKYDISLDENGTASKYFLYDEGTDEYRLTEVPMTTLL